MTEELYPETSKKTIIFSASAVIVILVILFVILYGAEKEQPKLPTIEYNHYTFTNVAGFWETDFMLNGQTYTPTFRFNPYDVENVTIQGALNPNFNNRPIYLAFNPETDPETYKYQALAFTELSLNLVRALNKTIEAACTVNVTDACLNRTIVTCQDDASVITLNPTGNASITLNNTCITITGQDFELIKATDRILYQWYKVIQ